MRPAFVQRLLPCFDDMPRRIEIRLADFQVNDVAPLSLKSAGPHQDFEGALNADAAHPPGKLHDNFRKNGTSLRN